MQYFENCECEGVLFLTFKGEGGSILTSKWAGVAIFWAGSTRPPHHGLWGEGGCDSNSSLQLIRPLSHPAIPSHILYSCVLWSTMSTRPTLTRPALPNTHHIQEPLITIMIPSMPENTSF